MVPKLRKKIKRVVRLAKKWLKKKYEAISILVWILYALINNSVLLLQNSCFLMWTNTEPDIYIFENIYIYL